MRALFSPDSKFMRIMGRVGDLMILNLLFILTCIPIVTIGAACTALYTVCFRFGTDQEGATIQTYFHTFRQELKQSTIMWLIIFVCGVTSGLNTLFFYRLDGSLHWAFILFGFLFVVVLLTGSYTFPLLSCFDNSVGATFKNALVLSLGYLPRSVLIVFFNAFPFAILFWDLYNFFSMGFLWAILYFALAAYVNSILLKKVFAPYLPDTNADEEPEAEEEEQ